MSPTRKDEADVCSLQLYIGPPSVPYLHYAVSPSALLSRLSSTSTSPPHPALVLSLIPFLLPISPCTALSTRARIEEITGSLASAARAHSYMALTAADNRLIDVVSASCIRGLTSYYAAHFLEGWGTASSGTSMAWAAGLGKLGGVGERFAQGGTGRSERVDREKKLRLIRRKGTIAPPPKDAKEYGERVFLL